MVRTGQGSESDRRQVWRKRNREVYPLCGPLACETAASCRSSNAGDGGPWLISHHLLSAPAPVVHPQLLSAGVLHSWPAGCLCTGKSLSRWFTAALQADLLASRKCQAFAVPSNLPSPQGSSSHKAAFSICAHRHLQSPGETHYSLNNSLIGFHSNPIHTSLGLSQMTGGRIKRGNSRFPQGRTLSTPRSSSHGIHF